MSLFTPYESRPPFCQAVLIWYDTVDEIAGYYSAGGYETSVTRRGDTVTLRIVHEDVGDRPGCNLTAEIPGMDEQGAMNRQMLVYGHPPTLVPENEFRARWREAKELP